MKQFIIPGNTPSSKNSKQWNGKFLMANKNTQKWRKDNEKVFEQFKEEFKEEVEGLDKPYLIYFSFVRKSRHKADFTNLCQAPLDLMVKYGWIEDDNLDEILPIPLIDPQTGKCHSWDKENPCTIITIMND